jgi:hypothetical protein
MKEFASVHEVSFQDVLEILQQWDEGILEFDKVQAWAECVLETGWHDYDQDDPRSLLIHVIGMLDDMYIKPVLKQDIPMLQRVLHEALAAPASAWNILNAFVKSIDWGHRNERANENIRKYQSPRLDAITDL